MAGLKNFIKYKGASDEWSDGAPGHPRPNSQVLVVEFPWMMLMHSNRGRYLPNGYLSALRSWEFEFDDTTFKVEIYNGFNDLWWISHICALRYMWDAPDLLRQWDQMLVDHPAWNSWAAFVLDHQNEANYNSNHGLMNGTISTLVTPQEVLKQLKENPKPLEGNAKGIHVAWNCNDKMLYPNRPYSLEERYKQLIGEIH